MKPKINGFSTEIRSTFDTNYVKVFFLDDTVAQKAQEMIRSLNYVRVVNLTKSSSAAHPEVSLTVYPKPMVTAEYCEQEIKEELCDMLQKDGYLVEAITEYEDAARLLAALRPDLVILDLNLPEISGFQICQELKNKTAIPVLVLTSRDQVKDELQAFHLGADEYLTKPCRKDRLLARVSNILKRYEGRTNLIEGPDFLLDQQTYTLYIHNTSVVLPKNQGKLLVALLSGGDALVTTEQLCIALWGTTEYIDENALQVNLTRLKKTMSGLEMKQRIVAVRGMGYRLETGVAP